MCRLPTHVLCVVLCCAFQINLEEKMKHSNELRDAGFRLDTQKVASADYFKVTLGTFPPFCLIYNNMYL